MSLFTRRKDRAVRNFILKLLNTQCPKLTNVLDENRGDSRVSFVVVVTIIPVADGQPQVERAFYAITKEFSNLGIALVLNGRLNLREVLVGLRFEGETTFVRAVARHIEPMGGGFYQLGLRLVEIVSPADYPELESVETVQAAERLT